MPRQLTNTNLLQLSTAAAVIHEVSMNSPILMHHAALHHAYLLITAVTDPPTEPAGVGAPIGANTKAPPTQAAPPPTPTPVPLRAHDAAVKANATRKANTRNAAATAEKIGANTKAPEPSDEPAVTE